uniref:Trans-cinnamate 4-monooxygenase n=1 Tax=Arundo donax TaxID=35708 RepID=A0A0A9D2L0_ARUDO
MLSSFFLLCFCTGTVLSDGDAYIVVEVRCCSFLGYVSCRLIDNL